MNDIYVSMDDTNGLFAALAAACRPEPEPEPKPDPAVLLARWRSLRDDVIRAADRHVASGAPSSDALDRAVQALQTHRDDHGWG